MFASEYTVNQVTAGERVQVCKTTSLTCDGIEVLLSDLELTASNAVGESLPTRLSGEPTTTPSVIIGTHQ